MGNFFKKYWWVLVIIIFLLILIIIWLLFLGKEKKESEVTAPQSTQSTEATKSTIPSSQITQNESDEDLLKKAVSEKTGIALDIIVVDVSTNTGKYAKGLVTSKGETVGGGYWLAVKENGKWTVVFDGQSTPECSLVDPPGFPASMVPECFDSSGNIVTRT
ncbi:MAG: hypothetical protein WD187_04330 [Candidatus Woykebacteria bacterium]